MCFNDKKIVWQKQNIFVCQECGYESAKWLEMSACNGWSTFVEEITTSKIF